LNLPATRQSTADLAYAQDRRDTHRPLCSQRGKPAEMILTYFVAQNLMVKEDGRVKGVILR